MFKSLLLLSYLLIGCVASQPQLASAPTPIVVDPAQNMPVPPIVLPKPYVSPSDKQVFKGDLWELRASKEWKQTSGGGVELLLFTKDETVMAILLKEDFVGDLDSFSSHIMEMMKSNRGEVTTTRTTYVNTRKSIEIEALMEDGVVWVWAFTTGAEGYVFTCGGEVVAFEKNYHLCIELLKGLYIGKVP